MRIFSKAKAHDYYDSAMLGQPGDPNITYVRQPEDIKVNYPTELVNEIGNKLYILDDYYGRVMLKAEKFSIVGYPVHILFAGNLYQPLIFLANPDVRFYNDNYRGIGELFEHDYKDMHRYTFVYNIEQLYSYINHLQFSQKDKECIINNLNKTDLENLQSYFKDNHAVKVSDQHFILCNSPIIVFNSFLPRISSRDKKSSVVTSIRKDANLKMLSFHKQMNPFEAYQQLENYVSTVFGSAAPITVEVSNSQKIVKAGFDLKTSFRKEKEV